MSQGNGSNGGDNARFATHGHEEKHSICRDEEPYLGPPMTPIVALDEAGEVEITTGQKMISAMSGSLFTSLIGTCSLYPSACVALTDIGLQ